MFRTWLAALGERAEPLPYGSRVALQSLLRQLSWLEGEARKLEREVGKLAEAPRHVVAVRALSRLAGVGVWTALVFAPLDVFGGFSVLLISHCLPCLTPRSLFFEI